MLMSMVLFSFSLHARDHLIYSIAQDIPMGYENEIIKKNYYINIGNNQGVNSGAKLDVFRVISKVDPYDNQKRINYNVKIGTLEVIHSDDEAAIATLDSFENEKKSPLLDINNFMIGDAVSVNVK